MPLLVQLHRLEGRRLSLRGELSAAELELEGVDELIRFPGPVRYELEVQRVGQGLLVTGRLCLTLACTCVRCLHDFGMPLDFPDWVSHVPLEGEDRAPVVHDCVDLTPVVREDILLAFPQHPVCGSGCAGLPDSAAGRAKPASPTNHRPNGASAWAVLNQLKL
jgi:DUF177 domain-containing protein